MKIKTITFFPSYFSCSAQELAYIRAFGSKVYFESPDTSIWKLDYNSMTEYRNHVLMFDHISIIDSLGREIEPVMSFIFLLYMRQASVGLQVIYSTLSPCDMCSGAILLYKIPKVVVGENITFKGPEDYLRSRGIEIEILIFPNAPFSSRKAV